MHAYSGAEHKVWQRHLHPIRGKELQIATKHHCDKVAQFNLSLLVLQQISDKAL